MHLRLLPEKGKIKFGGVGKMKNLVYDLSHGEFRSMNELYAQPITEHNVRLMGELAAVNAIRTLLPYYGEQMDRLYRALFKDIHSMNNPEYTFSDAYDVAQTAVCFLWELKGRKVTENYGISHNKNITILTACYRVLNKYLEQFRQKILHTKQTNISDDRHGLAAPATVRQIREEDYLKLDTIMNAMNMTERQHFRYTSARYFDYCCFPAEVRGDLLPAFLRRTGSIERACRTDSPRPPRLTLPTLGLPS